MAEASGAAAEESTGPSLLQAITTSTGLHRFGLYIEQHAPQLRPLLHFCIDVERLRLQSEEELKLGVSNPPSCDHVVWTYLKKGSPRSLHRSNDERLAPLPAAETEEEAALIGLGDLQTIVLRAQSLLQSDLLPGFMEVEGEHLTPKDPSAVHAQIDQEFAEEAPQAIPQILQQQKKAAQIQRNRYNSRLGIMGGGYGRSQQQDDYDDGETIISIGGPVDTPVQLPGIQEDAPVEPAEPPSAANASEPAAAADERKSSSNLDPMRASLKAENTTLDDFRVVKVLGKGSFGTVVKVVQKSTNNIFAMKVMSKKELIRKKALRHIRRERSVLEYVSHPFVVGLLHAFITEAKVYLVLEFCAGADLHQHLMQSERGYFTEVQARFYTAELLLAIEYLHDLGVIYRDLKPENVLLDETGHVRLADFGLCRAGVNDDIGAQSFCGSPAYLSPEMVNRAGHGQATDWWGLGVLLYEMATGDPPFQGRDIEGLFQDIREQEVSMEPLKRLSEPTVQMIFGLLEKDPTKRYKPPEMKHHAFFASFDWAKLFNKEIDPPFVPGDTSVAEAEGEKDPKKSCSVM